MKRIVLALMLAVCAFAQKPEKPLKNGLYANFKTEFGDIKALLFEKDTPASVALFVMLAQGQQDFRDADGKITKGHYYDNTTFFRIMPKVMIQAGSPTGSEAFNCGLKIKDEELPGLKFRPGSLAIANTGAPDSGGCQFFFTTTNYPSWDMKYTIFGQAIDGLDVIDKIASVPVRDEHPIEPPKLISITFQRVGPMPNKKTK